MKTSRSLFITLVLITGSIQLYSCSKKGDQGPVLNIKDVAQVRGTTPSTMKFNLTLNKPATNAASIDYKLVDGTAVSPGDYAGASGTVSIPENQTQATIEVQIAGDPLNLRMTNLTFTINLSNPKSCTLSTASATGTIITEDGTCLSTDSSGYSTPLSYPGYSLIWSDEFTEKSLDPASWNTEIGTGSYGWGNNELEFYTDSPKNVFISNGNLIIEARKETIDKSSYTSARLTTLDKKVFRFGRIDIRAKLPVARGMWPALWMLGTNLSTVGWPACGEIDIMELVGTNPATVVGTMHWRNEGGSHASKGDSYSLSSGDFSGKFHVYSIIWVKDSIEWYVDDKLYFKGSAADTGVTDYPFNADQFFIFNVAVGGNWPGPPDYTTIFPQRMFVDYIRVFQ